MRREKGGEGEAREYCNISKANKKRSGGGVKKQELRGQFKEHDLWHTVG